MVVLALVTHHFLAIWVTDYEFLPFGLLLLCATATALVFPFIARTSSIVMIGTWIIAYYFVEVGVNRLQGFDASEVLTIVLGETSQLAILVYLAQQTARKVLEVEMAIFALGLDGPLSEVDEVAKMGSIEAELMRSRFSGRPLSVILMKINPDATHILDNQIIQNTIHRFQRQYHYSFMARFIQKEVRLIDKVLRDDANDQLVILCPELDGAQVEQLSQRVQRRIRDDLEIDI